MTFWFRPARIVNTSCSRLADYLNARRIKPHGSNYRYRPNHRVVNWGNSLPSSFPLALNQPQAVCKAINKQLTWDLLAHRRIPTVSYTTDPDFARQWLHLGIPVYRRETLTGFGGRGISVFRDLDSFESQDFDDSGAVTYTRGIPIHREFRVFVMDGSVVFLKEKKKRQGTDPDRYIRNHGDWVFCEQDLRPYPESVTEVSVKAVQVLGLDFGGVDVVLDKERREAHILEVNSAPGLTGSSVWKVGEAIKDAISRRDS